MNMDILKGILPPINLQKLCNPWEKLKGPEVAASFVPHSPKIQNVKIYVICEKKQCDN